MSIDKIHKFLLCTLISVVKFIYSEKATKFCEISTLLLIGKSKMEISQNFATFSEYMTFKVKLILYPRVKNSITQLTILDICCIAFCRLTFREFLTDTQWKKVTPRNLHEMQRRNKQRTMGSNY